MLRFVLLFAAPILLTWSNAGRAADMPPRFRVKLPTTVLTDVPLQFVRIEALRPDGKLDAAYNGRPLITGVMLTVREPKSGEEVDTALGAFHDGVLELRTDLPKGRKVFVTGDEIVVDPEGRNRTAVAVRRTNRWWSILPPLLAVALAIWLRNVFLAMFAAVWSGAIILLRWDVFAAFSATLETHVIGEIVARDPDTGEYGHLMIILFTMFLGAMIGVMACSGGTAAIVHRMARFTRKREHGQMMAWAMGLVVFFDDYANTLLVGGTMRPVTDRLKISREKLAFIVDSTAAPVAGLAIISTWVGVEVGFIQSTFDQIYASSKTDFNAYSTFIATIPFRFYPLHLLLFVLLIGYTGRDFGPMRRAEVRALRDGDLGATDARISGPEPSAAGPGPRRELLRTALIPLAALIVTIIAGLYISGAEGLAARNAALHDAGKDEIPGTLWSLLQHSKSNRVMFLSAFFASVTAVVSAVVFRCVSLGEAIEGWLGGARSMFTALIVLIFAWAIATVCDAGHLNTAGFLVEMSAGRVSAAWVPTIAFLLSATVSFATGSSFTTMGLLMPLFITMTHYLLAGDAGPDPNHPLMLASIGAVLAGAIFGDHCSPISDTTVLSSAASGCDHLQHVATQMPYAFAVGAIALLLGYVPVGFGLSPLIMLPLGVLAVYALVQFVGQPVDAAADSKPARPEAAATEVARPKLAPMTRPEEKQQAIRPEETQQAAEKLKQVDLDELDVDWDKLPD
jgi:Na+/H+ antiporter NhaC